LLNFQKQTLNGLAADVLQLQRVVVGLIATKSGPTEVPKASNMTPQLTKQGSRGADNRRQS
jgi:hypothetical protein